MNAREAQALFIIKELLTKLRDCMEYSGIEYKHGGDYMTTYDKAKKFADKLEEYGCHIRDCAVSGWEAGEATADGGYRTKINDKWYQNRPIDETPKCTCGLAEALKNREVRNE